MPTTEAFLLTQLVGDIYSLVALLSMLATNVLATSLIAFKAWSVLFTWFPVRSNSDRQPAEN